MLNKELKQEFINEVVSKVFKNSIEMRKYFKKEISNVLKTNQGFLIGFYKPRIEKRFCFSYNEHVKGDFERAQNMCNIEKNYFIENNLKEIESNFKKNIESKKLFMFNNYKESNIVVNIVNEEYVKKFPRGVEKGTTPYIELSNLDKEKYLNMQKEEIDKFKKRLNTYLKKYGVSKVKSWTYSCWD